jgi:FlaA1/EpsC-like NDP-sugar epimerase
LRPGEKLFEELNMHGEYLVATSHPQIKSYLSPFRVDPLQMQIHLQHLQAAVDEQDVARLVLLLKDLIPDYNPGAQLLKLALSVAPRDTRWGEADMLVDQAANFSAGANLNA